MENKLPQKIKNSVNVKCVSVSAQRAFKKYYPQYNSSLMFYGLPDLNEKERRKSHSELWRLLAIGQIVERKNFLLLLNAWEKFSLSVQSSVELVIVGQGEGSYFTTFLEKVKNLSNVKYLNFIPRDKMKDMYIQSDAFICVSVSDPLPVVVSEAFMFEIPCIIGSGVGQYEMIENGVNGYTCISEEEQSVEDAIYRAFCNRRNDSIGSEGRKLYDQYFSVKSVMDTVLDL